MTEDRALPERPLPPRAAVVDRKPRPDPGPVRIAMALTGIATASALLTAFLGSAAGANAAPAASPADVAVAVAPDQAVRHVTRYVQLAAGQTAPPAAIVQPAAAPKPRVVVVTTKQSGK